LALGELAGPLCGHGLALRVSLLAAEVFSLVVAGEIKPESAATAS
jgi:hypothetical protein